MSAQGTLSAADPLAFTYPDYPVFAASRSLSRCGKISLPYHPVCFRSPPSDRFSLSSISSTYLHIYICVYIFPLRHFGEHAGWMKHAEDPARSLGAPDGVALPLRVGVSADIRLRATLEAPQRLPACLFPLL